MLVLHAGARGPGEREAAVERAGSAPLKKEMDAIAALSGVKDIPAALGRMQLASARSDALEDDGRGRRQERR